jgi:DNA-binding transcriptional MocR family regulator
MTLQFADRLNNVENSAIRELFKLLGKPGIISFAGGFPDSAMFDVQGIREASNAALDQDPGAALQYGATEGFNPLREQLAHFMAQKGAHDVTAEQLIVTTGSQQALDLIGKTMISPGDKVIVEGPTFLATIQCFRLYGAELISAPVDGHGVKTDELDKLIAEHKPKFVYLIPTFGNPSGALLSAERRRPVLEMAVKHQTLIVEDDPYGDLYFGEAPPPSLLAMSPSVPGSRELLVHCGSLSKVLSPGLRVGWMVAPEALRAARAAGSDSSRRTRPALTNGEVILERSRLVSKLLEVSFVRVPICSTGGAPGRWKAGAFTMDWSMVEPAVAKS